MAELAVTPAVEVAKCAAIPLARQFYYVYSYRENILKLREQAASVENRRARLQQKVEEARMHGEEIFNDVMQWLSDAQEKREEVEQIIEAEGGAKKRFFFGLFPNLSTQYRFGRRACKKTMELVDFENKAPKEHVSHASPPLVIPDPVPKYIPSQSRSSELEEIVGALNEPTFRMIGVYGMPGLGKTTLVCQVAEKVKKRSMFEVVAVVTVKPYPDLDRIRGEIAKHLGLVYKPEATEEERRELLWKKLLEKRTVLLILDDLWEKFNFHKVGIPFGEYHRGCKLLLVSRRSDVLSATGSQKNIRLGLLSDSEAWKLFEKIVGNSLEEDHDLHSQAMEVVKACSGLPLSIVTMAGTLKEKRAVQEWEDALRRLTKLGETAADLQTIEEVDPSDGIEKVAYSAIKLSYENLKNHENADELQLFFLLCAMTSNALSIEHLSRCAKGWGFLKHITTMKDSRNRVFALIRCLKDSCLLIESDNMEQYSMHDLVRDIGISIASGEKNMLTLRQTELENWHSEDILKRYTSMFLWRVDVNDQLSGDLNCPQLTFFHLHPEHKHHGLPDNFFRRMCGLRVLNLIGIEFSQNLPSSIGSLKELRMLCLHQCLLEKIDIICELQNLEVLSLSRSTIKQLPRELRKLKQLRLLDLNNCKELKSVPAKTISSLSKLEELYLWESFDQWEEEQNASLFELKNLRQLIVLEIIVPNVKILPPGFFSMDLQQYRIRIAPPFWVFFPPRNASKVIEIMGFDTNDYTIKQFGATKLLAEAEVLFLERLRGVSSICFGLVKEGFSRLKELKITDSPNIRFIIEAKKKIPALKTLKLEALPKLEGFCYVDNDDSTVIEFPELHQLHLSVLEVLISFSIQAKENQQNSRCLPLFDKVSFPNLEELWLGSICSNKIWSVQNRFENLRTLEVVGCNNLRYLLTSSMSRYLMKLSHLDVYLCNAIEAILLVDDCEENKHTATVFPQLKELNLKDLPKLKRFNMRNSEQLPSASGDKAIDTKETGGTKLAEESPSSLFNEEVSFPNLRELSLDNICSKRIWGVPYGFENLSGLRVVHCHNLRFMVTSSMSRHLMKLCYLSIQECDAIEAILLVDDCKEHKNTAIVFPQLADLKLNCLPKLKRFNMRSSEQFPSASEDKAIESKEIGGTKLVEEYPSSLFNEEVSFPLLEYLTLYGLDNLKTIWHNQLDGSSLCVLKELRIGECGNLESIIPFNMERRLAALEVLGIGNCSSLREVFVTKDCHAEKWPSGEGVASKEWGAANLSFEKLKAVFVFECPILKTVFPAFIAKNLRILQIDDCEELEGIIARDEEGEVEIRSYFPKAEWVLLHRLPKLKYPVTLDGEVISKDEESKVKTENKSGNWE